MKTDNLIPKKSVAVKLVRKSAYNTLMISLHTFKTKDLANRFILKHLNDSQTVQCFIA